MVLDAVPGIVLRLQTKSVTTFFDFRASQPWAPSPLRDQQISGAILWGVAEILDVPFLILIFRRWVRADAREAAETDVMLDAAASPAPEVRTAGAPDANSELWWLTDPALRDRFSPGRRDR